MRQYGKDGIMRRITRKAMALATTMLLFASVCNINAYAAGAQLKVSEKFVTEAECSVERDSNGGMVITLTDVQPLTSVASRAGVNEFTKTMVAILPADETQGREILDNIESLRRGSGSHTDDGWFYSSSVFLQSTINYTTSTGSDGLSYGRITNVTISALTNSGSSISSMSLLMGQNGWATGGYKTQKKTFNATTARSFSAPSSWVSVLWDGSGDVGAHLTCTAVRQGGQSTFTLYNSIQ